jgi:hypothetical protein
MTKRLFVVFAAAFFGEAASGQTQGNPPCGLSSLIGTYAFIHDGIVFESGTHMAEVGVARFDGKGGWGHEATLMSNGEIRLLKANGTYRVNADCTGSAELHGAQSQVFAFDFVLLKGGSEVIQVATRADRSVTWEMRKQERDRCSNATIQGSYAIRLSGFDVKGDPIVGVGVATFDGKGTWSLKSTEVGRDVPIRHIDNPKGTYSVNANCTASASLAGTAVGDANWAAVIAGSGEEVFGIATTPPRGAVLWVLERQFPR